MEAALRQALAGCVAPVDVVAAALARVPAGQARALFTAPLVPAAVLVGLRRGAGGLQVILTRRADQLRDHPGQISFPGGRIAAADADPVATALREAAEEIGLAATAIEVLGCLDAHAVVTGFAVCPVVALVATDAVLTPHAGEVAEIFEVPLAFLAEPGRLQVTERSLRGVRLQTAGYQFGRHHIWGATAQMLRSLLEKLA